MPIALPNVTSRQTGWIGVDVGTSHVKLVQLTGGKRQPRMGAAAIIPRASAWNAAELSEDKALSSAGELAAAISLRPDFRGRRVAATLPMSLCQIHQFDRSLSAGSHRDRAVRQALEAANQKSAAGLQFSAWPAELNAERTAPVKTNVLALPQVWADQLCDDVAQSGWSCQLVDGVPWALARAVGMMPGADRQTPWAALDWGYSQATFCVVVEGRPAYVRGLKDCSLRELLNAVVEELAVTEDEALQLLQEYGLGGNESREVSKVIEEVVAQPLERLRQEIVRTISHIKGQRRAIVPQGVYLFGGGATMRGLAHHLTSKLDVPHRVWQLGGEDHDGGSPSVPHACLFGVAVALSALAWELK